MNGKRDPISRWSIRTKLTIIILALVIIPMTITAYYNLTQSQNEVEKIAREDLMELSYSASRHIEQILTENQRTSATLAGEPVVIEFLAASGDDRQDLLHSVNQTLLNFADTHPDYDAPGILDVNGIVVASVEESLVGKNRSFRDYFQESVQGKPYISDILVGRSTGRPGVFLTNPVITAEREIVGIDIVWLKADTIWDIIDSVAVGEAGIAYLVDHDGVIIAHPNRDLLYHSMGDLSTEAVTTISETIRFGTALDTDTPLIPKSLGMDDLASELILAQGSGTYRYYSTLDHRYHVVGYTQLESHPWTVVVDLPEAQFLAPLQQMKLVTWSSVGLAVLITLIISLILVRSITRPIHRIADAAIAVEQNQPFEPSDIQDISSGSGEIAHLGTVFSSMVLAQRQVVEDLRFSEIRFRSLVEHLPVITYAVALDESSTPLYVSPQVKEILGISAKEYKKDPDFRVEHLYHEDRERVLEELSCAHETGLPFVSEYRMTSIDGRMVWIRDEAEIIKDDKGNLLYLQGLMSDITKYKGADEALQKSEERFRAIFDSINDAVFIHDIETGGILDVNNKVLEMYGYSREEISQLDIHTISLGEAPYSQQDAFEWNKKAAMGEPQVFEWIAKHRLGRTFWVEVSMRSAVVGERKRLLVVVRDITERKQAENEIHKLNEELEQHVKDRTAELEDKNAELERMNKLFVGRELRMAELKKQIAEFEEKYSNSDSRT